MSDRERESASAADAAAQAFFVPPSMLSSEAARDAGFYAAPTALGSIGRIDRFSILRTLGMGGMGIVALAIDANRGEEVAIKLLRPELRHDANAAHRFLREALHMQQLHHPHILRVLEIGTDPASPYYVMPYLPKGALSGMLIENKPLDGKTALAIATQTAQAIAHAHVHGIIHRDLKPSNVLLGSDGTAYVSDFGLLRTFYNDTLVNPEKEHVEGTAPYMSPAVAAGEAEDTRCDIYAFGAMLYQMLTGRPPYEGSNNAQIIRRIIDQPPQPILRLNPVADRGLVAVAEGAMARSLRDRYAQMEDVMQDLRRLSTGRRPLGPRGGGGGVSRRRLLIVGGGLAGVMCVGGWAEWQRRRAAGSRVVPPIDQPPWSLPERAGGGEGEVFRIAAHDGIIRGVFLSDDERLAITTGDDGLMKCWDLQNRTCLRVFDSPRSSLWRQAHLSHDNAFALTTGYGGNVVLWDVATGKPVRSWPAGDLAPVAFSCDGKRIAYGAMEGDYIARVCNANSDEIVREFPMPYGESGSYYLAFTPDGRHLLIGGNQGSLRLMEIATGLAAINFGDQEAKVPFVAVSPDGRLAAATTWNGFLRVWDLLTNRCVASVKLSEREAWEIRFLRDGRRVMAWTQDRTMCVLDLEQGAAGQAKQFSESNLYAGVVSHMGRHAVICDPGGVLRLWRLPDPASAALSIKSSTVAPPNAPSERFRFAAHEGGTWSLVHHPKLPIVATTAGENDLALWDLRTRKLIRRIGGHGARLIYVTFSSDGAWVATTCKDQVVRMFETDTGNMIRSWKMGTGWNDVAFSADGRYIGMAGTDTPNLARIHDRQSGAVICDLAKSPAQFQLQHICRFTADGQGLLVADAAGTIKCLDVATGQFVYDLPGHDGEVSFIEVTADGRLAVSSGVDGTVRLWDMRQPKVSVVLKLSKRPIWRAHFADDAKSILYWGESRRIAKVELATQKELWRIESNVHVLYNAAFSPDRSYVVVGESVGGLRVWDLPA